MRKILLCVFVITFLCQTSAHASGAIQQQQGKKPTLRVGAPQGGKTSVTIRSIQNNPPSGYIPSMPDNTQARSPYEVAPPGSTSSPDEVSLGYEYGSTTAPGEIPKVGYIPPKNDSFSRKDITSKSSTRQSSVLQSQPAVSEESGQRSSKVLASQSNFGYFPPSTKPLTSDEVWRQLTTSSEVWYQIQNPQSRTTIVAEYIKKYQQKGVVINKTAEHYAVLIDDMAQGNPDLLTNSFDKVLEIVAIMEYDFDIGQNKDAMALQLLGKKGYLINKQRLAR